MKLLDMDLNLCTKILNAEQIRQADQFTIKNEPIASIDLMERASEAFVSEYNSQFNEGVPVKVFCGTGNNGGDGLAISRLLLRKGYQVEVYIIGDPQKASRDFQLNHELVKNYLEPYHLKTKKDFPVLVKDLVIIDAVFGSGLSRGVGGTYGELIDYINSSPCDKVIAVDIASGLGCESNFSDGKVMEVSDTITFQVTKLSHLLPQNFKYSGNVKRVDIGLDEEFINTQRTNYFYLTRDFAKSIYRPRPKFMHKGSAGHVLVIAGSKGKMGAATLAGKAALKSGCGLLTFYVPKCGANVLQTNRPEAMVQEDKGEDFISNSPNIEAFSAVGVGPGIGTNDKTGIALKELFVKAKSPLVVDADGINLISESRALLKTLPKGTVLTPHPGEFKRLAGEWKDDYDRLKLQIDFAEKHKIVVVLKGAHTSVVGPAGRVFFNSTGNPGMATAGSGDVLTGIIASLLGQGYESLEAAILGVYLHGWAGDLAAERMGMEAVIASDIIANLGRAFKQLY